jgi:hypothetical protein
VKCQKGSWKNMAEEKLGMKKKIGNGNVITRKEIENCGVWKKVQMEKAIEIFWRIKNRRKNSHEK